MLRRDRLVTPLVSLDNDAKLTIISALAGYGKTTLLADYVNRNFKPCCWLTLDENDRDPIIFIESLVQAIAQVYSEFSSPNQFLPSLVQTLLTQDSRAIESTSRLLANQIFSTIKEDFDLILDDYHLVDNELQINKFLSFFIKYLPDNCRVLLSSRSAPSLEVTQLILQGDVIGLGGQELKMTYAEVYSFLVENCRLPLSNREVEELTKKTDGWPVGIMLGSNKILHRLCNSTNFSNKEQLFHYLATEVLQQLPHKLQRFLLQTSVLEILSPNFCNRLLDINNAAQILYDCKHRYHLLNETNNQAYNNSESEENIEDDGSHHIDNKNYYHCHSLLRDFLLQMLQQQEPELYLQLNHKCATLFKEQDDMLNMMSHLLQAQDYDRIVSELISISDSHLKAGHSQTVKKWLEALPPQILYSQPDLLLVKARVLGFSGAFNEAYVTLDTLQYTTEDFANKQDYCSQVKLAKVCVLRAKLLRFETKYELAIKTLQEALEVILPLTNFKYNNEQEATSEDYFYQYANTLAECYMELGMCYGMDGKFELALTSLQAALAGFEQIKAKERLAHVHQCLSLTLDELGDKTAHRKHLESSLRYWREVNNTQGLVSTLVILAGYYLNSGEFDRANAILEQALAQAEKESYYYGQAYVMCYKGDLAIAIGQLLEALMFYERAEQLAKLANEKRLAVLVCGDKITCLRLLQDYAAADNILRQTQVALSAEQLTKGYISEMLRLSQIGLELDLKNFKVAKELLETNFEAIVLKKNKREYVIKCFYEARLLFELGKHKAALDILCKTLTYSGQLGTKISILRKEASKALPLLKFAQARLSGSNYAHIQSELNQLLIEAANLPLGVKIESKDVKDVAAGVSASVLQLKVNEAGQVQTKIEEQALTHSLNKIKLLQPKNSAKVTDSGSVSSQLNLTSKHKEQPLVAYGFSPTEVFVHNIQIRDWRTAKANEMLFLLLDRAKPLSKETIVDLLWPELPPTQADNLFRSTLFRLRKATSTEWVKRQNNTYELDIPYWYDVAEFEKLIRQGDKCSVSEKERAVECYRQASSLYRGAYLENLYSDWCIERQENLACLQVETLLKQAELQLQLNRYEEALASVERCITLDKCNEPAYLLQLRIYDQLDNSTLLVHAYQIYCQTLQKELGLEPSKEVQSFYNNAVESLESRTT